MREGQSYFMTLIIFDLETTGLSPYLHEIIQIAAVKVTVGAWDVSESFETFVKPERRVPSFITELTGIKQEHVDNAPSVKEALLSFSRFAGEGSILIAHNGLRFDMPFIRESCLRSGMPVRNTSAIDSRSFSRLLWGVRDGHSGHGLDAVMQRLGIAASTTHPRHDARGDVEMLADAVQQMWKRLCGTFSSCPVSQSTAVLPLVA